MKPPVSLGVLRGVLKDVQASGRAEKPLVVGGASPIVRDRTMPGNDALSDHALQFLKVSEKAANAAINDRQMPYEQEIARKQG